MVSSSWIFFCSKKLFFNKIIRASIYTHTHIWINYLACHFFFHFQSLTIKFFAFQKKKTRWNKFHWSDWSFTNHLRTRKLSLNPVFFCQKKKYETHLDPSKKSALKKTKKKICINPHQHTHTTLFFAYIGSVWQQLNDGKKTKEKNDNFNFIYCWCQHFFFHRRNEALVCVCVFKYSFEFESERKKTRTKMLLLSSHNLYFFFLQTWFCWKFFFLVKIIGKKNQAVNGWKWKCIGYTHTHTHKQTINNKSTTTTTTTKHRQIFCFFSIANQMNIWCSQHFFLLFCFPPT